VHLLRLRRRRSVRRGTRRFSSLRRRLEISRRRQLEMRCFALRRVPRRTDRLRRRRCTESLFSPKAREIRRCKRRDAPNLSPRDRLRRRRAPSLSALLSRRRRASARLRRCKRDAKLERYLQLRKSLKKSSKDDFLSDFSKDETEARNDK